MLLLITLLPLFGFLSGLLLGSRLGRHVSCILTTCLVAASFFLSCVLFCENLNGAIVLYSTVCNWISIENLKIDWILLSDPITIVMLCIVTCISTFVHIYSIEYMSNDPHQTRFMSYLSLFTFFMLILITAGNYLQMFVGWEGVGVSSYLLINFWFTRIQANKAAIKAMLVNRIGDFALLLAIFTIYFSCSSLDYNVVFSTVPLLLTETVNCASFKIPLLDIICIFLFFGAMGKSAQLGLHTWLPDAMEGPTPVSALIHAATMVTAGIFLISRSSFLFEFSVISLNLIVVVGACTAFFAATTGLFQNDIKKVIAYSTCSQLGYMVFACGLSNYSVGLFHLSNHAFFKALLFLGAGSIIHALSDEQDMRRMGGLKQLLPFSYSITIIGSLALIGFPFLAGFYSKDVILEVAVAKYTAQGHFSFILGSLAAFCTAFYSTRIIFAVFLGDTNGNKGVILNAHEGSWKMSFPLFCLTILSVFIGYLSKDLFIGFGTDFWGSSLFILPKNYVLPDSEFIKISYKILPLIFTILGVFFAGVLYKNYLFHFYNIKKEKIFQVIYTFFNKKWYFDRLYTEFLGQNGLLLSFNFFYVEVDRGLIEIFGPMGIVSLINQGIKFISKFQTKIVLDYLFFFVFFAQLFIALLLEF